MRADLIEMRIESSQADTPPLTPGDREMKRRRIHFVDVPEVTEFVVGDLIVADASTSNNDHVQAIILQAEGVCIHILEYTETGHCKLAVHNSHRP